MAQVEAEISQGQFLQWLRFFEAEPWGSEVDFLRFGTVAAAVINSSPNLKPGKLASALDFLPEHMRQRAAREASPGARIAKPQEVAMRDDRAMRAAFFGVFGRDADGNKLEE